MTESPLVFRLGRLVRRTVRWLLARRMALTYFGFGGLFLVLWLHWGFSLWSACLGTFLVYLVSGGWRFWKIVIKTFPRDMRAGIFLLKAKWLMKKYDENDDNVVTLFEKNLEKHPNKLCYVMVDGKSWTFREVDEYSNAFANYLHSQGYQKGDVVAVFMDNCPEYVCFWLGMAKIGVRAALINYNLRAESLIHCLKISEAKGVLFTGEFASALSDCKNVLSADLKYYCFNEAEDSLLPAVNLTQQIEQSSRKKPARPHISKFKDVLFYIYTSGTTGLPKAAVVIHSRYYYMAYSLHYLFNMTSDDIIYDTLPLYHTAGGILGVGQALLQGCTVVIRKKFSASRFWDDCIKYNCTIVQYIGEICRYLLAQPNKPTDRSHRVWCAYGNGLRPQIWSQFKQRFGIKWIGEFYGATEGNANILNPDNTEGAVGFCTQIAPAAYPITLVKVDEHTGELLRDANGMCIRCQPGEPGEMVGKIIEGDPLREFDGYVNKEATNKKIAADVFTKGDRAFLTGDVLVMDELGYLFFRDRTGDTFRWRGENVSTTEVEATISNIVKLSDAVVYGVEVPGLEGKAGMVAIVDENKSLDLAQLHIDLQKALPPYARPVFVRVVDQLQMTGTFKLKKMDYRKESFEPSKVKKDKLYYLDAKLGYKAIDAQAYQDIVSGKIRL